MKRLYYLISLGVASLMFGCATTPTSVVVAPVGPDPSAIETFAPMGGLQVFSRVHRESDDQNQGNDGDPVWFQHTDYDIYTLQGSLVQHVDNSVGHYAQSPRQVSLPAGRYLVKAQARDYSRVELPVTIERGRITRVHLDDAWKLPATTPKSQLVSLPNGKPVGWRAPSQSELQD